MRASNGKQTSLVFDACTLAAGNQSASRGRYELDVDAAPGERRAAWLSELHPHVEVIHVPHSLHTDWDDEALWAKWLALFRDRWPFADGPHAAGPDALFSSDPYIAELARRLDATAVVVDAERTNVPISATQIREAPGEHLHRLAPPVRAWVESEWL